MIQNRTIYPKNVLPSNSLRSWLSFQHFKVAISPKWRENRHYRVSSKKKGLQTVITFLIHIFDCFFRILILDLLKYCFKFFCSFLPMGFSILEQKCKDLTSKNDIFEGSISRKLIALDKYFFQYNYLRTCAQQRPHLQEWKNMSLKLTKFSLFD